MIQIVLSPTKTMQEVATQAVRVTVPHFLDKAKFLCDYINTLSFAEQKVLWKCNDTLVQQNRERFFKSDVALATTPALLSYQGIQYKYLDAKTFDFSDWDFANKNLKILSGLYGVLTPSDSIILYRLEMQSRIHCVFEHKAYTSLYDFWGTDICDFVQSQFLQNQENVIINLASNEYAKSIIPFCKNIVTCHFVKKIITNEGKVILKSLATAAKIARGQMARFIIKNRIETAEDLKQFAENNYVFSPDDSTDTDFVFIM